MTRELWQLAGLLVAVVVISACVGSSTAPTQPATPSESDTARATAVTTRTLGPAPTVEPTRAPTAEPAQGPTAPPTADATDVPVSELPAGSVVAGIPESIFENLDAMVPSGGYGGMELPPGARPELILLGSEEILVLDPRTGEIETTVDAPEVPQVNAVLATNDSVWVTDHDAGLVVRIDRESGEEVARIEIGGRAVSLLETEEGVWAGSGHGAIWSVKLIDPATNEVTRTLERGAFPGYGLGSFWFGRNQFDQSSTVRRVDPVSGEDLAEVPLGFGEQGCYVGGAYPDAVWGFCFLPSTPTVATRLDLEAGEVTATVPLDGGGGLVGVAGGYSWFYTDPSADLPARLLLVDNATNTVARVYANAPESLIVGERLWMLDRTARELRVLHIPDL